MTSLTERVLAGREPAFAMLYRPGAGLGDRVDVLAGPFTAFASLADLPLGPAPAEAPTQDHALTDGLRDSPADATHEHLVLIPYQQITERGFAGPRDGTPLQAMRIDTQETVPLGTLAQRLPDRRPAAGPGDFDLDDEQFALRAKAIVAEEIGSGAGANFVHKRTFSVDVSDYSLDDAFGFFRRLLLAESGVYWTFLIHTGERTLVGATPERHVSLARGTVVMNPISGTYRYPESGPTVRGVLDFLADRKEIDELSMVLDEELKMTARICAAGGRVAGPYLKEMARLAHTEYYIAGRCGRDPRQILHETLFAPTVTGSPLESACRVIERYEPEGRGYYSGAAALIGRDGAGAAAMDSAILIRTADISPAGRVRISVGATLVRHSDPASEAAETRAKTAGLVHALRGTEVGAARAHAADGHFAARLDVRRALAAPRPPARRPGRAGPGRDSAG
ncbi:MAG TPA: chorismate-binding protein [Actinocrinis sp.]|jgi:phenazine biosynthesis protein phzE